jgi:hypothetical protein
VVVYAGYNGGAGHMVKIKHNAIYTTGYLHLSRYGEGVRVGSRIKQGSIIGYVGSSGLATSTHLHFNFWKNGKSVDPLKVDLPPSEPIKKENIEDFQAGVEVMKKLLDALEYNAPREERIILASTEMHSMEETPAPLTR